MEKILFKNIQNYPEYSGTISEYEITGGYRTAAKVLKTVQPDEIVEEVKKSGVRGRGGAGFPAGVKWSFLPKGIDKPVYLTVNADEGEPGTFKDREIMEKDPHMLLEGIILTCFAIKSNKAYIYVRGEFVKSIKVLERAIGKAYEKGYLGKKIFDTDFDLDVYIHRGAGAYVCGEETALLNSLEGGRGTPRIKPPFPAVEGLYASPTIINNVETIANIPAIMEKGGDWYASIGTEKSNGTKLFGLSGNVNNPGQYELDLGHSIEDFIFNIGGGIKDGKQIKAVIAGGSSVPILTADEIKGLTMDYESLEAAGTYLGSGGVIVYDEDTCIVKATLRLAHFYHHESCGQCTPCREGTSWLLKILTRIENGEGQEGDLDLLLDICDNMEMKTICALGTAAAWPVQSAVNKFREEFEYHIKNKKCLVDKKREIV